MAQLDFYAVREDILEVIDVMFSLAPLRLYESYSKPDSEIREFKSAQEIVSSNHIDENHGSIFVRGWWETVTKSGQVRTFALKPKVGSYRQAIEGVGTFQLLQGKRDKDIENALRLSSFSHWNEKGAIQLSNYSEREIMEVNWQEFRSLSGKLSRHVKNKMQVAKLFKRPILPYAYKSLEGGTKLFGQPEIYTLKSKEIELKQGPLAKC